MSKIITITVFAKRRQTSDGKKFSTYFTTLPGDERAVKVKFREDCGAPDCPANIELMNGDCNLSKENYTDVVTGELKSVPVLWISKWSYSKDEYRDTSMDKYFC